MATTIYRQELVPWAYESDENGDGVRCSVCLECNRITLGPAVNVGVV